MKNIRTSAFFVLLLLVSTISNSQENKDAKTLIQKVLAKINSQKNIRLKTKKIESTATLQDEKMTNLKSQEIRTPIISDLVISKNKYSYTSPLLDLSFIDDGVNLFSINDIDEEIIIRKSSKDFTSTYGQYEFDFLMVLFFIENYNNYLFEIFDFKLGDKTGNDQTIFLQKKENNESFDYMVIIDVDSLQILVLLTKWNILVARNKSIYCHAFEIESYETNVILPSNFFGIKKEKYKSFDVIRD